MVMKVILIRMLRYLKQSSLNFGHQKNLEMHGDNMFSKTVAKIISTHYT